MLHILLDTSIYRSDPSRRTAAFQILTDLCEAQAVTLHVPSIVEREFITHRAQEAESLLAKTLTAVKKLARASAPEDARSQVEEVVKTLQGFNGAYGKHVEESFQTWLTEMRAELHEPRSEGVNQVIENYFSGGPPFKKIKNRDDFPDAFIWQIINDIAAGKDELSVVVADNHFREAISLIPNVKVFESLDALIESQKIQDIYHDTLAQKHAAQILKSFQANDEFIKEALVNAVAIGIGDARVRHRGDEDTRVVEITNLITCRLEFAQGHYYGENIFRLPFQAEFDGRLDYVLSKEAFYEMPDPVWKSIDIEEADWNPHYMWVSESQVLTVSGMLAISVDIPAIIADSSTGEFHDELVSDYSDVAVDKIESIEIKDEWEV